MLERRSRRFRRWMALWTGAPLGFLALLQACAPSAREVARPALAASGLESTGFAERADWPSTVLHLDRDELRDEVLSLLFREIPGLEVARPQGESWGVYRAESPESARCPLALWIDGEWTGRVENPSAPLDIDSAIPVSLLVGLEIHLGMEGPVFDERLCGAMLAWTRTTEEWADLEFEGKIHAQVYGAAADTIVGVRVDPIGEYARLDAGGGSTFRVLPGKYEVVFMTANGPLTRRSVRVHAYREAAIRLEVTDEKPETNGHALGVKRDEFDLEYIVHYDVWRPAG